MRKLIYLFLPFLFACGPSQFEIDQQKKEADNKELEQFKQSEEFKEYKKKHDIISQTVQEMAEEQIVRSKNVYYEIETVSPKDQYICLYKFDGCEYIGALNGNNGDYVAHKGNCKFCHKRDSLMIVAIIKELMPGIVKHNSYPN